MILRGGALMMKKMNFDKSSRVLIKITTYGMAFMLYNLRVAIAFAVRELIELH
jgi:hypothetical protein